MHEHKIIQFATMNFERKLRGPMPIRNLVVAREEAHINEKRRDILAHSREYELRAKGDHAGADIAALEGGGISAFSMPSKNEMDTKP